MTVWMVLMFPTFDTAHSCFIRKTVSIIFMLKVISTSPNVPWGPGDIYKKEHPTVIQEADWTPFIFSNATGLLKLLYCSDVPVLPMISDVSLIDGQALIWEWWELHLGIVRGLGLIDFSGRLDNSWLLSSALTFKDCEFQREVKEWFRPFVRTRHIDLNKIVPNNKIDLIHLFPDEQTAFWIMGGPSALGNFFSTNNSKL